MREGFDPMPTDTSGATLDPGEVERFGRIAGEWWDPDGKLGPLHRIGPARMAFIRRECVRHFNLDPTRLRPLAGKSVLDVGCGGGLASEPLARLGGTVTAIDPAPENIAAAKAHAGPQGLAIDYRAARLEDVIAGGDVFDIVVCLEVLEHIPSPGAFLAELARAVKPGGLLIVSTINRTMKAYALAIVGAEYVLRWLPAGTHQWDRFITIDELERYAAAAGLQSPRFEGLVLDVLSGAWTTGSDTDVNYMAALGKALPAPE